MNSNMTGQGNGLSPRFQERQVGGKVPRAVELSAAPCRGVGLVRRTLLNSRCRAVSPLPQDRRTSLRDVKGAERHQGVPCASGVPIPKTMTTPPRRAQPPVLRIAKQPNAR